MNVVTNYSTVQERCNLGNNDTRAPQHLHVREDLHVVGRRVMGWVINSAPEA